MPFSQFDKDFSWPQAEETILDFWETERIFERASEATKDRERFVFYEGPPTANGRPGIHHLISRTIKDMVCRYKVMRGYRVDRKGGWDTHGLPVEIEVEKRLGLKNKQEVVKFGVAEFNQQCRNSVFTYLEDWNRLTRRTAFWLDLESPYVTLENNYIESVWWILKDFFDRGLVYQGHRTVPFCPRCETGLSSHEVAQGYEEIADPSVYVKIKALDKDYSFLVWTTTPWTLPSNVALAVRGDAEYAVVRFGEEKILLARELVDPVFTMLKRDDRSAPEPQVLETVKGAELVGAQYEPLFDFYPEFKAPAYTVVAADFVTLDDGSGIVHIATGFGADDFEVGMREGLPVAQAIEPNGHFKDLAGKYAGMWIKDADGEIIKDLKVSGKLFKKEKYVHSYPFCWRCHSPLIYLARPSWYIRTTQFRDELLASSQAVNWKPPETGSGRMNNWLENNVDWAISRERFWGTPLPFWKCETEGCEKMRAVGSVEHLLAEAIEPPDRDEIDLHKPQMDEVLLKCECGGTMRRIPELCDVWFDSGAMPYAQWHYPFENKELVEQVTFPADFIAEAIDQTRGWFYSLLAIGALLKAGHPELGPHKTGQAFKNVVVMDFILDKYGKKMSKHKGNVVDPFEMVDRYGSDPLRWYLLTVSSPWTPTKFDEEGLKETLRKYFDTLRNCYNFLALYANIDEIKDRAEAAGLTVSEYLSARAGEPERIDRWIISKYNSIIANTVRELDDYELTRPLRKISDFVIDDLSNWYVRRNRKRFWSSGEDTGKMRAYLTLYEILLGVSKLTAPATPLISETLYRELTDTETLERIPSIHMVDYPEADRDLIDAELEMTMGLVQRIVTLGRSARTRHNLKIRQPLAEMSVALPNGIAFDSLAGDIAEIKGELNLKDISALDNSSDFVSYTAKLNFAVAGKKFGGRVKQLAPVVAGLGSEEICQLKEQGKIEIDFAGQALQLSAEDALITRNEREGYAVESYGGVTVALSTRLTPELIAEGFARETVNRIQNLRKQANFEVTDRIEIDIATSAKLKAALRTHEALLRRETLAERLQVLDCENGDMAGDISQEYDINGERATISLQRI